MFPPVSHAHSDVFVSSLSNQVPGILKKHSEDTSFTSENAQGIRKTIPVPAGTDIVLDAPGLHYNRKVFFKR